MKLEYTNKNNFHQKRLDLRRIIILLSLVFLSQCKQANDSEDLTALLGLIPEDNSWKVLFSYPGRNTSLQKREEAKKEIISIISETKRSLLIHAYGLTDEDIIKEIARAMERSVEVKIVADSERNYELLKSYKIPYAIWRGSGLHHIKVILSDHTRMFTGTGNFTTQGLLTDYDGYLSLRFSESMGREFESLINEKYSYPLLSWNGFYFYNSPGNGRQIQKRILDEVRNAKRKIQFLIYSHSDPLLSYELIRASKRGVLVEGIYDRPISDQGKILATLLPQTGSRIYEDENEDRIDDGIFGLGGLNHHKTIIIDDEILLSGSFNFSLNARDSNRELFYETKNAKIIEEFTKEFHRVKNSSRIYPPSFLEMDELTSKSRFVFENGFGIFRSLGIRADSNFGNFHPISSGLFAGSRKTENLHWLTSSQIDSSLHPFRNYSSPNLGVEAKLLLALPTLSLRSLDANHSLGSILVFERQVELKRAHVWTWNRGWSSSELVKLSKQEYLLMGDVLKGANPTAWLVLEGREGQENFASCFYPKGRSFPSELEYLAEENQIQNMIQFGRRVGSCSEI